VVQAIVVVSPVLSPLSRLKSQYWKKTSIN
jgi:hypothetical protein